MTAVWPLGQRTPMMRGVARRVVIEAIAVALAASAAFMVTAMVRLAIERQPVVSLAAPLRQGQRITAADLRVTYVIGSSPALPAADLRALVGQYAISPLNDGSLVTKADVSTEPIPVP
jgi:flagella basal body P-ring formation protein FlgA